VIVTLAIYYSTRRSAALARKLLKAPALGSQPAAGTWGTLSGQVRDPRDHGPGEMRAAAAIVIEEHMPQITESTQIRENVLASFVFRLDHGQGGVEINPAEAYWASDVRVYPTFDDARVQLVRAEMIPDGASALVAGSFDPRKGPGSERLTRAKKAPLIVFACAQQTDALEVLRRKMALRTRVLAVLLATSALIGFSVPLIRPYLPPIRSPWSD
jgi:hypothetical protein